jgi:hypothetical protein
VFIGEIRGEKCFGFGWLKTKKPPEGAAPSQMGPGIQGLLQETPPRACGAKVPANVKLKKAAVKIIGPEC